MKTCSEHVCHDKITLTAFYLIEIHFAHSAFTRRNWKECDINKIKYVVRVIQHRLSIFIFDNYYQTYALFYVNNVSL